MARALAVVLGIASALPLVYLVYFVWDTASLRLGAPPEVAGSETLFHLAVIGFVAALSAAYLVMLYRSTLVRGDRRRLWAVVLLLGNVFAFPVFWYFFLWKGRTDEGRK